MIKKKYLLILGGSIDQVFLIKTAKKINYKTICLDKNKNAIAKNISDIFINVDFSKINEVKKKIYKYRKSISGVITMGSDCPEDVSKISKYLKIKSLSLETAKICKNKLLMKKIFKRIKVPTADFIFTKSFKRTLNFFRQNHYKPIIIKPINLAGSRGVFLIEKEECIERQVNKLLKITKNKKFIAEQYLAGPQISTETLVQKKKIYTLGFADRNYQDTKRFRPQIIENGGSVPSLYKKYKKNIDKIIKKIILYINFSDGVIKGDFVINNNKTKIIEFAGRLSGGDFCESLVPLSTKKNYVIDAIKIATNQKNFKITKKVKYNEIVKNRYFFLKEGVFESVLGIKKIKKINELHKIALNIKKKHKISNPTSHSSRAGVFIVKGRSQYKVNKAIEKIYSTIKFKINGKFYSGDPKKW